MKLRIALAAALLAASTGVTFAQTPPPPPPPPAGADVPPPPSLDEGARPGEDGRQGERGPRGDRGRGYDRWHGGPRGMHGRGPDGASFQLRMGDRRVSVDCGQEELKACIEASRPLIDLMGEEGSSALPNPRSESLTMPPSPPAPGDMPPTIPGTDAPPVAPAN